MWLRVTAYFPGEFADTTKVKIGVNTDHIKKVSPSNDRGSEAKAKIAFSDGEVIHTIESDTFILAAIAGELVGRTDESAGAIRG